MGKNRNYFKEENATDEIMEAPVEEVAAEAALEVAPVVDEAPAPVPTPEPVKETPKKVEVAKPVAEINNVNKLVKAKGTATL